MICSTTCCDPVQGVEEGPPPGGLRQSCGKPRTCSLHGARWAFVCKTPSPHSVDNAFEFKSFCNSNGSIDQRRGLKTHYEILGLLSTADDVVVKAAYKALAQKYHPDKYKLDPEEANRWMVALNAAHAVLCNKTKRKAYDDWLLARSKKVTKSKAKTAATAGPSQATTANHQALIAQLQKNALDEIVVVELYEKFFGCKVKIINGWVNSYAVQSGKKAIHLDFVKLKSRIIEHLEQL